MQLPDWITRKPLLAALVAAALVGLVIGWFNTPPPPPSIQQHHEAAWAPPQAGDVQRFDDKAFQSLKRSTSWADARGKAGAKGAHGTNGNDGDDSPAWSLVGIVLTPQPAALVIDASNSQVERVAAGAALPDGSTLDHIEHNIISVSHAGCTRRVVLFGAPQDTPDEVCPPANQAAASPPVTGDHP